MTIMQAGIKEGTLITVDYNVIQINVRVPSGSTIQINVDPDETVQTIVDKIAAKETLSKDTFTLKKDDTELDTTKTIYEAGITAGSTISVDIKEISIKIKLS